MHYLHFSLPKRWNWRRVLHFSLPKICNLVSPVLFFLNGAEFTLSVAKNVELFETVRILRKIRTLRDRFTSVKWRNKGSKHRNKRSNFGWTVLLLIEKWIKLIPKTIGNRKKRLCLRLRSKPPEKIFRSKSTNQEGVRSAHRTDLCFSIWRFSQVVFIPRAQPHAQSLFSISNSFWY